jgi:hypothetical protein
MPTPAPTPPHPHHSKPVNAGYDMVAYFDEQQSHQGSSQYKYVMTTYDYSSNPNGDVIADYDFHFKNVENLEKFKADPWRYAPKYGGF